MPRKPPSQGTAQLVLVSSRRRCCICFGLRRDFGVNRGQIAHIDRDPENSGIDNLAYLCLPDHDWFDSESSQSKRPMTGEIREYREELYAEVLRRWAPPPPASTQSVTDGISLEDSKVPKSEGREFPVDAGTEDESQGAQKLVMKVVHRTRIGQRFDGLETMSWDERYSVASG